MQFFSFLVLICSLFSTNVYAQNTLRSDEEALFFVQQQENSYIAIIWPRAMNAQKYIRNTLELCAGAKIVYVKDFYLTETGVCNFFKNAHRHASAAYLERAMQNYLLDVSPPYHLQAVLLECNRGINALTECKKSIRKKVGIGFWSIHINDTYLQTIEMAEAVFDDSILKLYNAIACDKIG